MKKILMVCILLTAFALAFASCNAGDVQQSEATETEKINDEKVTDQTEDHIHAFGEWTVEVPACTWEGIETRICECGVKEVQTLAPASHIFEKKVCQSCGIEWCEDLSYKNNPDKQTLMVQKISMYCEDTHVVIPDEHNGKKITHIGELAFNDCPNIETITIPASITDIPAKAFNYCPKLKNILVDPNNPSYKTIDGSLYSKDGELLIRYAPGKEETAVTIPDTVKGIGTYAFYLTDITSISIPDSVTSIGDGAFSECYSLADITIGDGVTSVGSNIFVHCQKLVNISLSENNPSLKLVDGHLYSKNGEVFIRYDFTKTDTYFEIPNGVTTIEAYAFENCSNIEEIVIPDSVTSLGEEAFYKCKIKKATLPSIAAIYVRNQFLETANITSGESIEASAFFHCGRLKSVTLPDSVTSIGNGAFMRCALEYITLPDGLKSIGGCAFDSCEKLKAITLPEGLKSIGEAAFGGCSELKSITLPEGLEGIEAFVFSGSGITSITIPSGITTIGDWAFWNCTSLESVVMPEGITVIEEAAFNNCSKLSEISMPDSITNIEVSVFKGTAYYNDPSNWDNGVLYIGKHLIEATDDLVGDYTIRSDTKTIAEHAFDYLSNVTGIIIPEGITHIPDSAFSVCKKLESLTIPVSVTSIGAMAVRHCNSLKGITYMGTIEQWNSIDKVYGWNDTYYSRYIIHCVDGDI